MNFNLVKYNNLIIVVNKLLSKFNLQKYNIISKMSINFFQDSITIIG